MRVSIAQQISPIVNEGIFFDCGKHTTAHLMIAPGVRVARGPDWSWKNQGKYICLDLTYEEFVICV